jgi:hypothetical protein
LWNAGAFDLNDGVCHTFHESDTLTPGSYWTQKCSLFSEDECRDQAYPYVYAKCDNFNNPDYNTDVPTTSPTSPPSKTIGTANPPTNNILTPVQGRCAWTQPECLSLQSVLNKGNQHSDVALLHTELCQAFASLGQYPASLHCPSAGHQNVTGTLKRVDQPSNGELTAAFNYSTCGGGLKLRRSTGSVLMEWKIDAKVANTVPMNLLDSESLCFKVCVLQVFGVVYKNWL